MKTPKDQANAATEATAETSTENAATEATAETSTENAAPATEAETSIENAAAEGTTETSIENAATEATAETSTENADQPLDGPAPVAEGATGADTAEGGADADPVETDEAKGAEVFHTIEEIEWILNDIGAATANGTVPDHLRVKLDANECVTTDHKTGNVTVSILGITATSTFGLHRALLDWCMAASRTLMAGKSEA